MNYHSTIEDPCLPTIKRWHDLNRRFAGNSTLRMLQYEQLSKIELSGTVLDLGGGESARYKDHLPPSISELISINIDPNINPTHLLKPGEKFPLADNSIDNCITLNTLEHVYDSVFLLEEIFRVLKPGGKVHITVPWIFRIHGHPDDYSRYTPSWWAESMKNTQFSNATILPLVWGRNSTVSSFTGSRGIFKKFRNQWRHYSDVLYAKFRFARTNGKYSGKRGKRICAIALGHFISAEK